MTKPIAIQEELECAKRVYRVAVERQRTVIFEAFCMVYEEITGLSTSMAMKNRILSDVDQLETLKGTPNVNY